MHHFRVQAQWYRATLDMMLRIEIPFVNLRDAVRNWYLERMIICCQQYRYV